MKKHLYCKGLKGTKICMRLRCMYTEMFQSKLGHLLHVHCNDLAVKIGASF